MTYKAVMPILILMGSDPILYKILYGRFICIIYRPIYNHKWRANGYLYLRITYSAHIEKKYKIKWTNHSKVLQKLSLYGLPCLNMKYLVPFKLKDVTIIYSQIKKYSVFVKIVTRTSEQKNSMYVMNLHTRQSQIKFFIRYTRIKTNSLNHIYTVKVHIKIYGPVEWFPRKSKFFSSSSCPWF